jgi:hypothetical protein
MEYLAAHPSFKMKYSRGTNLIDLLSKYAKANWGNSSSSISTSGMVMLYNKSLSMIMWKSKMQKTTALSTAEVEYYSASAAGCEVLYLQALLDRLRFKQKKPTPIYEDNTACIEWGNNVIGRHERAKYIDIWKHFANEVIQNGAMRPIKVPTAQQMADILTKGLHLPQVLACVDGLLGRKSAPGT